MSRWYQNALTGQKVEVKTLDEDDYYAANRSNWVRVAAPPVVVRPAAVPPVIGGPPPSDKPIIPAPKPGLPPRKR